MAFVPHGEIDCIICLQDKLRAMEEQKKKLQREINYMKSLMGESIE